MENIKLITEVMKMPQLIVPTDKNIQPPTFVQLFRPVQEILKAVPPLESQSSRPLALTFEDQLKALRDLKFIEIPFIVSPNYNKRRHNYEDINCDSERSYTTNDRINRSID